MQNFIIVTPNLNMAHFLKATIESVLANLGPNDLYFIVDGGSTDGSIDIIRSYESSLSGWISEPDNGYADAIAKGFEMGEGAYMAWVNSGDVLLNGSLDLAREELKNSGADLIFCDDFYFDEQGIIQYSYGNVSNLRNYMLYGGWTPLQDACFWKSYLYKKVGGIDRQLKLAADYDFFLKMSLRGKSYYRPYIMSGFRRHGQQKSIVFNIAYNKERDTLRKTTLLQQNEAAIIKHLKSAWYFVAMRCTLVIYYYKARKKNIKFIGMKIEQISAGRTL